MSYPYKKVFMIGATSGIGLALTKRLVSNGVHVIASGRRVENLEALQQDLGKDKVTTLRFDISDISSIKQTVEEVIKTHPDLDQVFINAGLQRGMDFTKSESIDWSAFELELTTNYTAAVALTLAFLPFLKAQQQKTSLVYTTSGLAITPLVRCAGYSATKAALHAFILCLREQVQNDHLKIIELYPPAVQTELHLAKHQPDIKDGANFGMPLDKFTDEAYAGLETDQEQIYVQTLPKAKEADQQRQQVMRDMWARMKSTK